MQARLYGIIYRAVSPSGKAYIGQTTQTLASRRSQHKNECRCTTFAKAVKKHGDKMRWEVIASAWDKAGLDAAEIALIAQHRTIAPHGYNLMTGGSNGKPNAETRAKISAATRGKKRSPEHCARQSKMRRGVKRSPEVCAKISAGKMGRKLSPAHRANISAGQRGKKMSPEAIEKSRLANIGRPRTAAHRAKTSATFKRKWADPAFRRKMLSARRRAVV